MALIIVSFFYIFLAVWIENPGLQVYKDFPFLEARFKNLDILFAFTQSAFLIKMYEKVCDIDKSSDLNTKKYISDIGSNS